MTRLDDYRSALQAGFPEISDEELVRILDGRGSDFSVFIVDHGLGPIWHQRTGREEFRESRMQAEALYMVQQKALAEVATLLDDAALQHAVVKGGANRLLLYGNPALRACHDLDVLVLPDDRVRAAEILVNSGFVAIPDPAGISRGLVLRRSDVDIDLHWGLLREGRLRDDPVSAMLGRRRRKFDLWVPGAEDAMFILLVHPAFAKHLGGWDMGLHRVLDVLGWMRTLSFDWRVVSELLEQCGVRTAAWATLTWVATLAADRSPPELGRMLAELQPGYARAAWIGYWLRNDFSALTADAHWARLLGFSFFLHDTHKDAFRAFAGRRHAQRRQAEDLAAFEKLFRE